MSDIAAGASYAGPRILLVDDERQFRSALRKQLSVRGYDITDTDNGRDAVRLVRHERPEVVVLDQKMPDMDGIQTLKEIKKARPDVRVIMLTGFEAPETLIEGVFRCLTKPCGLEELVEVIEAARRERASARAERKALNIENGKIGNWLINMYNDQPGLTVTTIILAAILIGLALVRILSG